MTSNRVFKGELGKLASDFTLRDVNGELFKLSDFRGNWVFLNFWATWCPTCLEELPAMEAFNERLKAKNFTMIGVSVDRSWGDIENFFSRLSRRPTFLTLLDARSEVAGGYGTTKFPETYVVDPHGVLVKKYIGAINWTDPKVLSEWDNLFVKGE